MDRRITYDLGFGWADTTTKENDRHVPALWESDATPHDFVIASDPYPMGKTSLSLFDSCLWRNATDTFKMWIQYDDDDNDNIIINVIYYIHDDEMIIIMMITSS